MIHRNSDQIICPHCGEDQARSEEYGNSVSDSGDAECQKCGKEFFWARNFHIDYSSSTDKWDI